MFTPIVKSISQGSIIVPGGSRLSREEEAALNVLLRRAAGEEQGMPLYRLSWAIEDNAATFDSLTDTYKFDPNRIPLCIEPNQASYHLLAWSPPTATDMMHEHEFLGEDLSRGLYTCILHFLDPQTGNPFNPTASILEHIIPVLSEFNQIARATWHGMVAERNKLRTQKINAWKEQEKLAEKRYEKYAEALLEDSKPAFEGNPFVGAQSRGRDFANRLPGERDPKRERIAEIHSAEAVEVGFTFSSKAPKKQPEKE